MATRGIHRLLYGRVVVAMDPDRVKIEAAPRDRGQASAHQHVFANHAVLGQNERTVRVVRERRVDMRVAAYE